MSRNRAAAKPRLLSDEELNKKIAGLIFGYQNIRPSFIKLHSQLIWGSTTSYGDSYAVFQAYLTRLIETAIEIDNQLTAQTRFHNEFYLAKIKLKALTARYNIFGGKVAMAASQFRAIIQELIELLNNKEFTYAHDFQFQFDVNAAFQSAHSTFVEDEDHRSSVLFNLKTLGIKFANKCPDNIVKLRFLFSFWYTARATGALLINDISVAERQIFIDVYKKTIAGYEQVLTADPTHTEHAIRCCDANIMAFKLESATHPLSVWQQNLKAEEIVEKLEIATKLSLEDMRKYVKYTNESFNKYLDSSIKHLMRADPNKLKENAELLFELPVVLNDLLSTVGIHIKTYLSWLQKNLSDDFDHELLLTLLHLIEMLADIHEIFRYHQLDTPHTYAKEIATALLPAMASANPAMLPLIRQACDLHKRDLKEFKSEKFAKRVVAAEEHAKFLLAWEERENKRLEAIKARSQSAPKPAVGKKPEETKQQTSKSHHYLSRAAYYARNRRSAEALELYELTYKDAVKTNDSLTQLATLDGQLFVYGRTLLENAESIRARLASRLKSFKKMSVKQQDELKELIKSTSSELQQLLKLHTLYNAMSHDPELLTDNDEGIKLSKELIAELIGKLNATMRESQDLFSQLSAQLERRRANFIQRCGGLEAFKELGEKRRRAGKQVSAFTREKETIKSLADDFQRIHSTTTTLTSTYETPTQTNVLLSASLKEIFHSLDSIPGEHLLVGSNVALLLSSKDHRKKLNVHDLDFASSCKDEGALKAQGFVRSFDLVGLYQKFEPAQIDIHLAKTSSDNWLYEDASTRDFTICAVYIDKNGKTHDPLGTGIDDIANKRLRIIGDPIVRLREDPKRALRAIRYMLAGYQPDQALIDALKALAMPEQKYQPALSAVARKHLLYFDRKQYVSLLQQYNLLEKMFGISDESADIALWKLEKMVGVQAPQQAKHISIFKRATEAPASLCIATKQMKLTSQ